MRLSGAVLDFMSIAVAPVILKKCTADLARWKDAQYSRFFDVIAVLKTAKVEVAGFVRIQPCNVRTI
jgi:hypothetical protein